jgi:hypothetical protein
MRDERGRYNSLKEIAENGPTWAKGCTSCQFGIVAAPDLTHAAPLYMERLVQAIDGDITFCACQAGQRYRVSLLNRNRAITSQDKVDERIITHKIAGSEQTLTPENTLRIDSPLSIARQAINAARALNVPTIHMAGEPA